MNEKKVDWDPLEQIRVVLVEPKEPGNVGSVARAMKNMGLAKLYLVNPPDFESGDARKMATGSGDVLYGATVSDSLQSALSGTVLSVATTHRRRQHFEQPSSPQEAARKLTSLPPNAEGALVLGREDSGLTNEELHLCSMVARIPTAQQYPSLNLAQAALIFAYELFRAAAAGPETRRQDLASFEQVESLYEHIASALDKLGFVSSQRPETFMHSIRRTFGRMALERAEIVTLHKIFRQVDKFVAHTSFQNEQNSNSVTTTNKKRTP